MKDWVGFDLDRTLAAYDGWKGADVIGKPIPAMVDRLKQHLAQGDQVKIFTARIFPLGVAGEHDCYRVAEAKEAEEAINRWCREHIGCDLPITCVKDFGMTLLYDDRCKQVLPNTGIVVGE